MFGFFFGWRFEILSFGEIGGLSIGFLPVLTGTGGWRMKGAIGPKIEILKTDRIASILVTTTEYFSI